MSSQYNYATADKVMPQGTGLEKTLMSWENIEPEWSND